MAERRTRLVPVLIFGLLALLSLLLWQMQVSHRRQILRSYTDTDVPWWDALPTTGSVAGQWLLGRKYVENWPVWVAVNVISMGLFAWKGLWLTVLLYGLFAVLALVGWRAWRKMADA